jgi:hypothetical protein
MQNLPNEIIVEISKYLAPIDIIRLSSTCKEYKDIFDKTVKTYKKIDEFCSNRCFEVYIVSSPITSYIYTVYLRRSKCTRVIVKKRVYVEEMCKNVDLDETNEMSFDMFLYYAGKSYIGLFECINSRCEDDIFDINKMRNRVNKLIETYKTRGALMTMILFKKYTDRIDFGISIIELFNVEKAG